MSKQTIPEKTQASPFLEMKLTKAEIQKLLKLQFASYDPTKPMEYPEFLQMTGRLMDALKTFN